MTALLNALSFFDTSFDISFDIAFDDRLTAVTVLHVPDIGVRNFTLTLTGYGREHRARSGRCTGHE
ncbi:hypothetical protein SAMN06272781_2863 [Streptomyces sp. 1222.2]|uniref:hypothetical protein n=1 Tax=Streptomyces sp. 1222.2 TaxID=1938833 RepID=UPI000BC696D3|nr:hypothetical protein [Streptomyces sp. 1222.2]SOD72023.1 hypothetical protein SAMN06272781_2863 [Streptomyces sp. 1222.2]